MRTRKRYDQYVFALNLQVEMVECPYLLLNIVTFFILKYGPEMYGGESVHDLTNLIRGIFVDCIGKNLRKLGKQIDSFPTTNGEQEAKEIVFFFIFSQTLLLMFMYPQNM